MKKSFMFIYSIICYLIGFASLLLLILSLSQLIPAISIDRTPTMSFGLALLKNLSLVLLFAVPHSVMARKQFKEWITKYMPRPIERSTYVLTAGILLTLLVVQWEPMGGILWTIDPGTSSYFFMYALFFIGWGILFISTFLINHFDLFGLRQTYLELQNKPYTQLEFRITAFYKYVRHPLYFGGIVGLWATTTMSMTHLVCAVLLSAYFVIGAFFEERDLRREFGELYKAYMKKTPMILPFTRWNSK